MAAKTTVSPYNVWLGCKNKLEAITILKDTFNQIFLRNVKTEKDTETFHNLAAIISHENPY
jgi:hypothetical protein